MERFDAESLEQPEAEPRYRILDDHELECLPDPSWRIQGLLQDGGFGVMVGAPEAGKTFAALDMSYAISEGSDWQGRPARMGSVLYASAEGLGGLKHRVTAQKAVRGISQANVFFHLGAVPLMNFAETSAFVESVLDRMVIPPQLVVLDTWARCISPGDESSSQDTGIAVKSVDLIRERLETAVLVLHHPPKAGETARGSGALEGAADTVWWLRDEEGVRVLECRKQKDATYFDPIRFRLISVGVSLVVGPADAVSTTSSLTPSQSRAVLALQSIDVGIGTLSTEWMEAVSISRASFFRVRKQLADLGLTQERKNRWNLTAHGEAVAVSLSNGGLRVVS